MSSSPAELPQDIETRLEIAAEHLTQCMLCPRRCGVNRLKRKGVCGIGDQILIASANLHSGEEPPISGSSGSGTIFFCGCNLRCVFCQNYPISQLRHGRAVTVLELATSMISLQKRGAHNINWVTPSHMLPLILPALVLARREGLTVPLIYNSSGYDSPEALALLDGLVQVYLPDMRYSDNEPARRFSGVGDYVEVNRAAIREMFRQVGLLEKGDDEVARRGLIIRHLVLPDGLAGTEATFAWLAREISPDVTISLMRQYFPAHKAHDMPPLDRGVTDEEYHVALDLRETYGLFEGWDQE